MDELGLEQVERKEAHRSGFMQKVLLPRYNEQRSTIITSNIPWEAWGEYLDDHLGATAIIDRLLHHSHVLVINGPSYREWAHRQETKALKYPDIIPAPITLTTAVPPLRVVAPASGELVILAHAAQPVGSGEPVALIRNSVDWDALSHLQRWLQQLGNLHPEAASRWVDSRPPANLSLGELQPSFTEFQHRLEAYQFVLAQQAGVLRGKAIDVERESRERLLDRQLAQLETFAKERQIATQSLRRLESLRNKRLVSDEQVDERRAALLAVEKGEKALGTLMADTRVEIAQLEKEAVASDLAHADDLQHSWINAEVAFQNLQSAIRQWEHKYLLRAPRAGRVSWSSYWSDYQPIKAGDEVFAIVPGVKQAVIGKVSMPMHNSGKVKPGQAVYIKLDAFPYGEFGTLKGQVKSIALIPDDQNYQIEVELQQQLVTSYHKELEFRKEMFGRAEVVTMALRLLERMFYQLISVWKT